MRSSGGLRLGILAILAFSIALGNPVCFGQEPRAAGVGPVVSLSLGYAYLNNEIPSAGRVGQNGVASGISTDLTPRFGIKTEVSYTRSSGAFGVDHHSDFLAYLGGPVVYPIRRHRFDIYTQALIGGARITGVIPQTNTTFLLGETNKLAWALGPGVDAKLSRSTVLRAGVDYLHAVYFTPSGALHGQGNLRVTISLVYTLGKFH